MIVYGDSMRPADPADVCRSITATLEALAAPGRTGIDRHAALVHAFVAASELVQGLADAEFEARGCDARSRVQDSGMRLLMHLARAIARSWHGGLCEPDGLPAEAADLLAALEMPDAIWVSKAEGYRHYALYPETYLLAARGSGLGRGTRVVGIRSIGVGLAALVAAALRAPPPISVRPTGHPFRRRIDAARELSDEVRAAGAVEFAIVDEGPGLSGSSFAAVQDWLQACGVAPRRIHLFPSHPGPPGPEASPACRDAWLRSSRRHVAFETALLDAPEPSHRLGSWVAELIGPLDEPLQDISGGAWRGLRYARAADWPSADPRVERRKFLAHSGGRAWLVKFAGLGADGARKLATARLLDAAGLAPEVAGLRHGFLVERWLEGAPLDAVAVPRQRLLRALGAYLGFRARLPAPEG
nr:hypothetical protein [Paracoccaceae bacterium]